MGQVIFNAFLSITHLKLLFPAIGFEAISSENDKHFVTSQWLFHTNPKKHNTNDLNKNIHLVILKMKAQHPN